MRRHLSMQEYLGAGLVPAVDVFVSTGALPSLNDRYDSAPDTPMMDSESEADATLEYWQNLPEHRTDGLLAGALVVSNQRARQELWGSRVPREHEAPCDLWGRE